MLSKYHVLLDVLHRRKARQPILLLSVALLALCRTGKAQLESRPIVHNGYRRPYLIFRPTHLLAHPAAIFMLGGVGSTASSEAVEFGWTQKAEQEGFLAIFPEPVATRPDLPADRKHNVTFWEMKGSRSHLLVPGALRVDDDGYLSAVLRDVLRRDHPNRKRIFLAGFSSGSGMVQLFAVRHPREVSGIVAVATPLMDPPARLSHPVPILYIHGDDDEQFSGFEINSPQFATTPHGNWVTWGYLDGCQQQTAEKTEWGVRFLWRGCKDRVPVIADFVQHLGHEWSGAVDARWDPKYWPDDPPNFTDMAWLFFKSLQPASSHPPA
jgi:poly(3-hydroxybutyrate) depolymerase